MVAVPACPQSRAQAMNSKLANQPCIRNDISHPVGGIVHEKLLRHKPQERSPNRADWQTIRLAPEPWDERLLGLPSAERQHARGRQQQLCDRVEPDGGLRQALRILRGPGGSTWTCGRSSHPLSPSGFAYSFARNSLTHSTTRTAGLPTSNIASSQKGRINAW